MRLVGDGVMSGYICIWCIMVKMEAFNMIFNVPKPQFIALSHGYMPGSGFTSRRPPVSPKRSSTINARTIRYIYMYFPDRQQGEELSSPDSMSSRYKVLSPCSRLPVYSDL
jgi:hypothetical protein